MSQGKIVRVNVDVLMPLVVERLQAGQEVVLTVTGGSMRPLFWHGRTRVLLAKAEGESLRKYDIPLYKRENGQYVLHRVIKVKKGNEGYIITGDAQWETEEVLPSRVLGKVIGIYRGERLLPVTAFRYRLYERVWTALLPVRRQIFWALRKGKRLCRKLGVLKK